MKLLRKIKLGLITIGTTIMMIPTKIFAVGREEADLYGAPEEFIIRDTTNTARNTVKAVKETSTTFEPDSMFLIRCLTFFLVPLIFILGLIIYTKKSKSQKSTRVVVTVFTTILIIAMLIGAILFVVGSISGWF